jgi:hypothetical protein
VTVTFLSPIPPREHTHMSSMLPNKPSVSCSDGDSLSLSDGDVDVRHVLRVVKPLPFHLLPSVEGQKDREKRRKRKRERESARERARTRGNERERERARESVQKSAKERARERARERE